MALKVAVLAAAASAALIASFGPGVSTASANQAKFVRCLANPLTITSVGHGLWGTDERTTVAAINDWQSTASQRVGNYYANWSNALGGNVNCHRDLFKVVCVASATPCRS